MGRNYLNSFTNVAVSAAQDLLAMSMTTNGYMEITRVTLNCVAPTLATAQMLQLSCYIIQGGDSGSAGSSNPAVAIDGNSETAGASCYQNNTTIATGTQQLIWTGGMYLFQGLDLVFTDPIPMCPIATFTQFVFNLASTPIGTINLSSQIYFTEKGYKGG